MPIFLYYSLIQYNVSSRRRRNDISRPFRWYFQHGVSHQSYAPFYSYGRRTDRRTDGRTDRNIAYCPSYGRQTVDDDAIFTALYRANCLAS